MLASVAEEGPPAALPSDPDKRALLLVQQWLHEAGHASALAALEREGGALYDADALPRASELMRVRLLWGPRLVVLAAAGCWLLALPALLLLAVFDKPREQLKSFSASSQNKQKQNKCDTPAALRRDGARGGRGRTGRPRGARAR